MPEVFKKYGYSFYFYSREHEPIHIHVEGEDGLVIYDLIDDKFVLREKKGKIKVASIRKIFKIITDRKQEIIDAWNKYFECK